MVHFSFLMLSFKNLNIFENLNMLKIQDLINNTSKHAEKINLKSINKNNNLRAYIRQCILKKKKNPTSLMSQHLPVKLSNYLYLP